MSKPKFDPSKEFIPVSDNKPKFDPSKPFDSVDDTSGESGVVNKAFDLTETVGGTALKPAAWALEKASPVFEAINKYGANPIRKGIYALEEGKDIPTALSEAKEQFGSDEGVISGKDIAEKAGISNKALSEYAPQLFNETGKGWRLQKGGLLDVSPAGVAGFGTDVVTDPLTYVGAGLLKKTAGPIAEAGKNIAEELPSAVKSAASKGKQLLQESPLVERVKGTLEKINAPSAMEEIKNKVSKTEAAKGELTLPQYETIQGIEKRLPDLEHKLLPGQKEMYRSGEARDIIKTYREMPGENPEAYRKYELAQRQEGIDKIDSLAKQLNPSVEKDAASRGERLLDLLNETYQTNKDLAGSSLGELDNIPVPQITGGNDLVDKISSKLGLDKYVIESAADDAPNALGIKKLALYSREMGISPKVHGLVNEVIDIVNNKELSIKDLRSIRESLRNEITPALSQTEKAQIGRLRAAMLDHIEDIAADKMPNSRSFFKEYAKNESASDQLEKLLGGSLDNPYEITKNVKPEKAVEKLFSNTNNVKLARDFLGEQFQSLKGDYLQNLIDKASPNGQFSAQKFKTLLDKNSPVLKEAFSDSPMALQRAHDLADFVRLIPEAPTINPSGTAKTTNMIGLLKKAGSAAKEPWKVPGKIAESAAEAIENRGISKKAEGFLTNKK